MVRRVAVRKSNSARPAKSETSPVCQDNSKSVAADKAGRAAKKTPAAVAAKKLDAKARTVAVVEKELSFTPTLKAAMTGGASPAKAMDGDEPVFVYLRSLPQPQRGIAERVDALAAETLPGLQRAVKWGMAWYGVGEGWCFSCGAFTGHVKLTFGRGTLLEPVPPVTPIGMGKDSRGVDVASIVDLDERQAASWMRQATAIPGFGRKKK